MKNYWIWVAVVVIAVLLGGYFGRHRIKTMLMGQSTAPTPTSSEMMSPSAAASGDLVMTKSDPTKGNYLTDSKGMTIYVFDKDKVGVSNCNGGCATAWPPYMVASSSQAMPANITAIKRADGSMQYAWKGMPLYFYASDSKVGDLTGDGVGGIWHLVKP